MEPTPTAAVPTLLISGTCGAGKSTVALEAHDLLGAARIPHALVDLDALTQHWPVEPPFNRALMLENLSALWPNHRRRGASRLLLAGVVEERAELAGYREAIPGARIVVCRLLAPHALRIERLRTRMPPGPARDWHVRRTVELEEILEAGGAEDFAVTNGERPSRETAREVLERAGWLPTG
jgi:hypothetical protein